MSNNPVVAGIYTNAFDATMARNRLEDEGIKALLADDLSNALGWQMPVAMGGVKVLVRDDDYRRAEVILATMNQSDADEVKLEPDGDEAEYSALKQCDVPAEINTRQMEEVAISDRERLAEDAWKAALISILFLPLQLYVVWMLLGIAGSKAELRPRFLRLAWWAAGVSISALVVLAAMLVFKCLI